MDLLLSILQQNQNSNMKNLKTFTEFVNESTVNAELEELVIEGALAAKGANHLSDVNLQDMIDDADDDDAKDYKSIAKKLGSDPKLVVQVDSETNEDDPIQRKIYNFLSSKGDFTQEVDPKSKGMIQYCMYDPKMNVVRLDDYGFIGYYFTKDSKF